MTDRIALLRGINVGGANNLNMADLRGLAERLGWSDVRTVLASGNLLFRSEFSPRFLANQMTDALERAFGLNLSVIVLISASFGEALDACPFEPEDDRQVHLFFPDSEIWLDQEIIGNFRAQSEELRINANIAYFYTPDGFGRSKLAAKMESALGSTATGRNLRTCRKIANLSG
ncbi:MAG: DUF1697 domain-containing protein [Heliomarina sp.]|uniref:DUF1697 domain-containing protein n=1 Tax=Heliomarina sp. TaxID=2917556 RepID=UPI004059E672